MFVLYQLKDVTQVWYTKLKGNRPVESGPIEWDEFKEYFFVSTFPVRGERLT